MALRHLDAASFAATAPALLTTVGLALCGAILTVGIGIYAAKRSDKSAPRVSRGAIRLATLGYAMPGTVLAAECSLGRRVREVADVAVPQASH